MSGNDVEDSFGTFEAVASSAPLILRPTSGPHSSRLGDMGMGVHGERTSSGSRLGTVHASSSTYQPPSPLGRQKYGVENKLGRSATYCPSQATALNRNDAASVEIVRAHKQVWLLSLLSGLESALYWNDNIVVPFE
jgi:hypothetical protein